MKGKKSLGLIFPLQINPVTLLNNPTLKITKRVSRFKINRFQKMKRKKRKKRKRKKRRKKKSTKNFVHLANMEGQKIANAKKNEKLIISLTQKFKSWWSKKSIA